MPSQFRRVEGFQRRVEVPPLEKRTIDERISTNIWKNTLGKNLKLTAQQMGEKLHKNETILQPKRVLLMIEVGKKSVNDIPDWANKCQNIADKAAQIFDLDDHEVVKMKTFCCVCQQIPQSLRKELENSGTCRGCIGTSKTFYGVRVIRVQSDITTRIESSLWMKYPL